MQPGVQPSSEELFDIVDMLVNKTGSQDLANLKSEHPMNLPSKLAQALNQYGYLRKPPQPMDVIALTRAFQGIAPKSNQLVHELLPGFFDNPRVVPQAKLAKHIENKTNINP